MLLISTTILDASVKKALIEKTYTDEEFRTLYASFLVLQTKRMKGFKFAALIVGTIFLLMSIVSFLSTTVEQNGSVLLIVVMMNIPILVRILFLAYYLVFGRFKQDFVKSASIHYADLMQNKQVGKNHR